MPTLQDERNDIDNPSTDGGSYYHPDNDIGFTSEEAETIRAMERGLEDPSVYGNHSTDTKAAEENPTNFSNEVEQNKGGFRNIPDKVKVLFSNKKSRNATVGVVGATGIVGILFTVFGPMSLVVSMTENLVSTNNGAERAFNRRIMKVLYTKMGMNTDNPEACLSKKVKCKMNTITTKGIKKFAKKGVVALDADGNDLSKSKGKYPSSKVARWEFDPGDGGKPMRVEPKNLKGFLANNPKMAAKLIGRSGAINLRFELWRGKFIKKHLYDRFKISRSGGLAGENSGRSKVSESLKKLKGKLPGLDGLSDKAATNSKNKINKMVGKGKKGGVGYLVAVGGCAVVKAPGIIAGAVAATQAARIMPLVMDLILSPGSMVKGSHITNPKSEAVENVLNTLTATDKNGKSALYSKILLGASGVNTARITPSKKFTPGYKLLTSPKMIAARKANREAEPACNVVMSPQFMYTAVALNVAVTVAASSTIVLGILKSGADFTVSWVVGKAAEKAIEYASKEAIDSLAKNDDLDKVLEGKPGEDLGDALGISAMAFFSTGAAARYVPVLKESQLKTVKALNEEDDRRTRQMEIATLSPFDISSKYTFMGSILNNVNMSIMSSGYTSYFSGAMSYLLHSPLSLLYSGASAADASYSENYCGNATEFGMDTKDDSIPDATPAINAAGMPCHGFVGNISTERAVDIATGSNKAGEKWVKDDFSDEATIDEIVEGDTRLADYIDGCGAAAIEAGEWTENSAGCTVDTADNNSTHIGSNILGSCSEEVTTDCVSEEADETNTKPSTAEESEALAAFVMDYQISQSVDGFDDEPTTSSGPGVNVMSYNIRLDSLTPSESRNPLVVDILNEKNPDIVGFQEMSDTQHKYISEHISGYNSTNDKNSSSRRIYWKSAIYDKVSEGYWNSTKDNGSNNMPWVKLKHIPSSVEFFVFNIHTSPDNDTSKREDGIKLREKIVGLTGNSTPFIVTGDANSGYPGHSGSGSTSFYDELIKNSTVRLSFNETSNVTNDRCETAHDFGRQDCDKNNARHIDHIYTSSNIIVNSWENIVNENTTNASDHNPIFVNLNIPGFSSGGGNSDSNWVWPVPGVKSMGTLGYGESGSKGIHKGIDIGESGGNSLGKKVVAAHSGVIDNVWGKSDGCGAYVSIKANGTKYYAAYQHLNGSSIRVGKGDTVSAGDTIGYIGRQGGSTCGSSGFYHLHFSIETKPGVSAYANKHPNGTIDPLKVLPR